MPRGKERGRGSQDGSRGSQQKNKIQKTSGKDASSADKEIKQRGTKEMGKESSGSGREEGNKSGNR